MPQISIVKLPDIKKVWRFDAETFKPKYLEIEKKLKRIKSVYINRIVGEYTNVAEVRNFYYLILELCRKR